jgi:hypothetical protein
MFAHSEFEREVRSLQAAITNDLSFGERRSNQWKARQRPERMAKLMKRYLGDDLQEAEPVAKLLSDAIGPCDRRNFLAHGEWWCFNTRTLTITIRSGTRWNDGHCRAPNRWAPCSTGMPLPSVEPATPPTDCGSPQTRSTSAREAWSSRAPRRPDAQVPWRTPRPSRSPSPRRGPATERASKQPKRTVGTIVKRSNAPGRTRRVSWSARG